MILYVAIHFSFACLVIALFLGVYRLLAGPTLPDRIVVLDLLAFVVIGLILVFIVQFGQTVYLNVAVIIALLVFMSTVAFAKYLKKRMENE
jgi:multicomponent Na+:H+ antiporter subunit F